MRGSLDARCDISMSVAGLAERITTVLILAVVLWALALFGAASGCGMTLVERLATSDMWCSGSSPCRSSLSRSLVDVLATPHSGHSYISVCQ